MAALPSLFQSYIVIFITILSFLQEDWRNATSVHFCNIIMMYSGNLNPSGNWRRKAGALPHKGSETVAFFGIQFADV
jgi:hypothetical protein